MIVMMMPLTILLRQTGEVWGVRGAREAFGRGRGGRGKGIVILEREEETAVVVEVGVTTKTRKKRMAERSQRKRERRQKAANLGIRSRSTNQARHIPMRWQEVDREKEGGPHMTNQLPQSLPTIPHHPH